jgi:glycosyltransferase involved in cell wall biosynthesis
VVTTSNPLLAEEFQPKSGRTALYRGPAPSTRILEGERERIVVWLGSPSTESYLRLLGSVPEELAADGWTCVAIGSTEAADRHGWHVVPWTLSAQDEWLARASVGVMPQPRDPWSDRKQAYKLFEYMAHGVVPVASDVPAARDLLCSPALSRLLVAPDGDWRAAIEDATTLRPTCLSEFPLVLEEHSVGAAVTTWLDAVGVATA